MVRVKICGNTNLEDALCAAESGADLLGFILYPQSPRSVSNDAAAEIVSELRLLAATASWRMPLCVGVFADESNSVIELTMQRVSLDAAQLHGNTTPADIAALSGRAYKAIKLIDATTPQFVAMANHGPDLPSLMIDSNHPTLHGGTGTRANEGVAAQLATTCNLLLAGGLTVENVIEAISVVKPWGVDVANGTERSPGLKDHAKVRAFIAAVRQSEK